MNIATRFCPICEQAMDDSVCTMDGVPTVLRIDIDEEGPLLPAGTLIANRYRIDGLVARGGMGDVYRAVQTSMNRQVAVKTLLKDLQRDPQLLKRFYREAKSASLVDHPNVVRIFDFGVDDESSVPFIAMEFLEGTTLTRVMRTHGPFDEVRSCTILVGVSRALAAAHAKDLVHRDLKPDNIQVQQLSDGEEHIKVFDFGIAKMKRQPGDSQKSMTEAGVAIGTPQYMSPEQAMGRAVDHRADLYSLGCILHEMLTGIPPFDGPEVMPILVDQAGTPPPKLPRILPTGRAPSPALDALYDALMEKRPESRPANANAVTRALRAMARGERHVQEFSATESPTIPPRPTSDGLRIPRPNPTAETVAHPSVSDGGTNPIAATVAHPSVSDGSPSAVQSSNSRETVDGFGPKITSLGEEDWGAPTVAAPSVESPAAAAPSEPPDAIEPEPETDSPSAPIATLANLDRVTDTRIPLPVQKSKGKGPLLVVAAIVLVGGGVLLASLSATAPKKTAPTPSTPSVSAAEPVVASGSTPAEKTQPATISVTVNSTPAGADIFEGSKKIGSTPYALALPEGVFPMAIRLEKTGFAATGTTLRADQGSVMVNLSPLPAIALDPDSPSVSPRGSVRRSPPPEKAGPAKKNGLGTASSTASPPPKKEASKKAVPKKAAPKKAAPKKAAPPKADKDIEVEVEAW